MNHQPYTLESLPRKVVNFIRVDREKKRSVLYKLTIVVIFINHDLCQHYLEMVLDFKDADRF